jgi:hypothetical protein
MDAATRLMHVPGLGLDAWAMPAGCVGGAAIRAAVVQVAHRLKTAAAAVRSPATASGGGRGGRAGRTTGGISSSARRVCRHQARRGQGHACKGAAAQPSE